MKKFEINQKFFNLFDNLKLIIKKIDFSFLKHFMFDSLILKHPIFVYMHAHIVEYILLAYMLMREII